MCCFNFRLAFQVYQEGGAEKSVLDFALRKAGVDTLVFHYSSVLISC
jgi:hypothetical protein